MDRPSTTLDWNSFRKHFAAILGGWLWFFLVLFSYYCLKPIRDGLGTRFAAGMGNLYLATLVATLLTFLVYAALVAWIPRRWIVVLVHHLFILQMLGFFAAFVSGSEHPAWLDAVFFVWVSVFNLFVVTLFWSVMADLLAEEDGKRWFGTMAAAGSLGSITGSAVAWYVSDRMGIAALLIVAAIALELSVLVAWSMDRAIVGGSARSARPNSESLAGGTLKPREEVQDKGTGGTLWSGLQGVATSPYLLGIAGFVALGKFVATFLYNFLQILLKSQMSDPQARTRLFSQMNLWSQGGSLLTQGLIAAWMLRRVGIGWTLAIPGLILGGMLLWIQWDPALDKMVITQVAQQVLGYGLLVPTQHVLFTVVSREEKFKAKAFIDNVVFRGSDAVSAKVCDALAKSTATLGRAASWVTPLLLIWAGLGLAIGELRKRRTNVDPERG